MKNIHQKFSSNLCSHCGGPAPGWKCPECGNTSTAYDPRHFLNCNGKGKMQPLCEKCGEAESQCTCAVVS